MAKSNRDNKKRPGRPKTTGSGILVGVRLHPDQLKKIDAWIRTEAPETSRPEAIRRLIDIGVVAKSGPGA